MSARATQRLMTTEELLAISDDGMERWLIKGQLREKYPECHDGKPMIVRNRFHCTTTAQTSVILNNWCDNQPKPRGEVYAGEVGVRLSQNPDTTVGIDVVYIDAETVARQTDEFTLIEGIPTLAVEVLSPTDTDDYFEEKVNTLIAAGVAHVWILDPDDHAVTVYRSSSRSQMLSADQELTAEPHLPGFRVLVANLFE